MRQEETKSRLRPRVVILGLAKKNLSSSQFDLVQAGSAYEAAAELLAAPTAAIVVQLNLLQDRHLQLVKIARQMGTAVFGVGKLSPALSAEQLSGMQLISLQEVNESISAAAEASAAKPANRPQAADQPAKHAAGLEEQPFTWPQTPAQPTQAEQSSFAAGLAAKPSEADEEQAAATTQVDQQKPAKLDQPQQPPQTAEASTKPPELGALLSSEELEALLDNGQ